MRALSRRGIAVVTLTAALLLGCERAQETPPVSSFEPEPSADTAAIDRHTQEAWLHGISLIDASLVQARQLRNAVEKLLAEPSEDRLLAARQAWHRSHNTYLSLELYTALSSSNAGVFGSLGEYDFAIEAWPIQPGYLDYFDVYSHSGIVNDTAMPLTAEALREQHGLTDAADVSLGFHAMEYLLWGENGQRPVSDFEKSTLSPEQAAAELREVDLPNNRRRDYLRLLADLLLDDLGAYKDAVENPNGLLRRSYFALHPYSRVALFEGAAQAMLSHHRELLKAQLETRNGDESDLVTAAELRHSPFAGGANQQLLQNLSTLRLVLLDSDVGLGQWLSQANSDEETPDAVELLSQVEDILASVQDGQWPPEGEKGAELLNNIAQLTERFGSRHTINQQQ